MLRFIARNFSVKLFLSYLIVIVVGTLVLASTTEFVVPEAFDQHMSSMGQMMMGGDLMNMELFTNFKAAVNTALTWAASAAFFSAIAVSIFISRGVVSPIKEMTAASRRIAQGRYQERVNVRGDLDEPDELGQLAISFNQMAENLYKTEEMRMQLIGDVSHELRTPLTTIMGSMEGLIDGVLPPDQKTYQFIFLEADRLQHLVQDLQDLSRIEAGAYELERTETSIIDLINDVVRRLEKQYRDKGVNLKAQVPDGLPSVNIDSDRIGQALFNLVSNALQYTAVGGEVIIRAYQQLDQWFISVEDTGIGISKEHLPNIFTRFYRVDKSRSRVGGGTGIGLTIAKHLVKAHGGSIWAESEGLGEGSTFAFSLPVSR